MFKDNEIIKHIFDAQVTISQLALAVGILNQRLGDIYKQNVALNEKVEYLAAAEEARATHSKKPTRKGKVEEVATNG